ncbi:E3 ubiquitin-protein ligase MSL2-like [Mizuhopecten yessoensis]|uniref:E3 ubiquitin-protein ligase MSL2-like n=1 Tax=Mizuhopecten yessoensis TaxID=6573 RepID=UPI000B4594DB|nr:E3 ubiquitin-protein ligase MSL2-like [Mizuhopecten yessoensis]
MNALNIYLTTCRYVMQADLADRETWSDLYRYLPFLRQALSCCVCRNLVVKPMGPVHNVCQHFVCFTCAGGKMKLKPQCSWCKHHEEFQENTQLRIAVICFKKLCEYISDSPIGKDLYLQSPSPNGETNNLNTIIKEALDFKDDFTLSSSLPLLSGLNLSTKHNNSPRLSSKSPTNCVKRSEQSHNSSGEKTVSPELSCSIRDKSNLCDTTNNVYPDMSCCSDITAEKDSESQLNSSSQSDESIEVDVTDTDTSTDSKPENSLKRKRDSDCGNRSVLFDSSESGILTSGSHGSRGDNSQLREPDKNRLTLTPGSEQKDLKICKCGRGGTNSRLTCLGQRCPCYINKLPCVGCKCKGCRNPRKIENDRLKIVNTDHSSEIGSIINSENVFVEV